MNIWDVYPPQYEPLLDTKVAKIKEAFAPLGIPEIEVFQSPREHYRMRAEFVVYHEDDECYYVMFDTPKADQGDAKEEAAPDEEEGRAKDEEEPASKRVKTEGNATAAGHAEGAEEGAKEGTDEAGEAAGPEMLEVGTLAHPTTKSERRKAKRIAKHAAKIKAKGPQAEKKVRVKITALPRASKQINDLMPKVLERVHANPLLKDRLFQVNFISTLAGDTLITLLYHKKLNEAWTEAARTLKADLGVDVILGRAKKQVIQLDRNYVVEELTVNGRKIKQKQVEGSFTQPNAIICQKMLEWSLDVTAAATDNSRDLLELYCGNGNFSLAMAPNFRRVLGTELSKVSVAAAQWNIEANGTKNVHIAAMSSQDFTALLKKGGPRSKLGGAHDITSYDFSTVLVDPPRAGMDEESCKMIQDYDAIVYISCNPDTLLENLETITKTHRVARFAVFDQFPYTAHLECGAYLVRRQ